MCENYIHIAAKRHGAHFMRLEEIGTLFGKHIMGISTNRGKQNKILILPERKSQRV